MKITKAYLNKEYDKYIERPFVILDFVIFTILILPMIFVFSENVLRVFHILDLSIWILIVMEVLFKFFVVPSKLNYVINDWEDILCAVLPILPNFKILKELKYLHINQIREGLRGVRAAAFVKRIYRRLKLIFIGEEKSVS